MKKLKRLNKVSDKYGIDVRITLCGGYGSVRIGPDGDDINLVQYHKETLGSLIGHAIETIETEYGNKPEPKDMTKIKISVRLDQQVGERWIDHQFDFPEDLHGLTVHISEVLEGAYHEYENKPASYGDWFDIIVILIRKADSTWVELRIARDDNSPFVWHTRERYPGSMGKSATFNNKMDGVPSAHLVGRFIMNTLVIAEKLAKRDNPATS